MCVSVLCQQIFKRAMYTNNQEIQAVQVSEWLSEWVMCGVEKEGSGTTYGTL